MEEEIKHDDGGDLGGVIKFLQRFNVSWRAFWIILFTILVALIVVVVWSQFCCEEVRPLVSNCSQVQWDYSCCKVKNFWNPWNGCIDKYEAVFESACLERGVSCAGWEVIE